MRVRVLLLASLLAVPSSSSALTYRVGPGQPLATPGEVPWESLNAGDSVLIHARPMPYTDKWVLCRVGTASAPIVVRGVPDATGALPVISGANATTRPTLNFWNEERGVLKIGGANNPPDALPAWIVIEGLEIRGARAGNTFTGRNGLTGYAANAAAIYIEKGENLVVRGCHLVDCGNGLFCALDTRALLVEGNFIEGNGNDGSIFEHNSYTEALGITFQFNHYGPLRPAAGGNNLKDRSSGTVIRYNWIEGGNRQLDLVDSDSPEIRADPAYRETFVYGNVLLEPGDIGNSQIVHYGGDSGTLSQYRQGTLYFHHNTVVSRRTGNTTLFRLSSTAESADARNNIVFVTATGSRLGLLDQTGALSVTRNWFKTGWIASHSGGAVNLTDNGQLTGTDPGFSNAAADVFELVSSSACVDAGVALAAAAVPDHVPVREYLVHQRERVRPADGHPDLGAFERGAPATDAPWPAPQAARLVALPNPLRSGGEIRLEGGERASAGASNPLELFDMNGRRVAVLAASEPGRWPVRGGDRLRGVYLARWGGLTRRIVVVP